MIHVQILRGKSSPEGLPGRIYYLGRQAGVLELPDRDNTPQLSCIIAGSYEVRWTYSHRLHKRTYEILNVPGRGGIRIHAGNFAGDVTKGFKSDSLGCPLLCRFFSRLSGQFAGLASRAVVSDFELVMAKRPFELEIKWT